MPPYAYLYPFWPLSTYTPCQLPNTPLTLPTPPENPPDSLMDSQHPLHSLGEPNAPLC